MVGRATATDDEKRAARLLATSLRRFIATAKAKRKHEKEIATFRPICFGGEVALFKEFKKLRVGVVPIWEFIGKNPGLTLCMMPLTGIPVLPSFLARFKYERMEPPLCCPRCYTPLVLNRSRLGTYLSCPNYPDCKSPEDIQKLPQHVTEYAPAA
jgi:Topoisomerase DNA binding C4 zinc finger